VRFIRVTYSANTNVTNTADLFTFASKRSTPMSESKDPNIAALLRELEGYELYGRKDRAAQVRADLKRRGYKDEKKSEEPKKRVSREAKQATADDSAKTG
jgi:hypothetical protein